LLLSTGPPDLGGVVDVDGKLLDIFLQYLNLNLDEIYRLRKTNDDPSGGIAQLSGFSRR
jgi:hypothetical protein